MAYVGVMVGVGVLVGVGVSVGVLGNVGEGDIVEVGVSVGGMGVSEGRGVRVLESGEEVSDGVEKLGCGVGAREVKPQASWAKKRMQKPMKKKGEDFRVIMVLAFSCIANPEKRMG
jgi:hypothetical protein